MTDHLWLHDIKPVIGTLKRLWLNGLRHPELTREMKAEFPGLSLTTFNQAADVVWDELRQSDEDPLHDK